IYLHPAPLAEGLQLPFLPDQFGTTPIYPLSLHDALPILAQVEVRRADVLREVLAGVAELQGEADHVLQDLPEGAARHERLVDGRSEEHTSELQSRENLVCRLLLEKKKRKPSCHGTFSSPY